MTRTIFHGSDARTMRDELKKIRKAKDEFESAEENLVRHLYIADKDRLFVWLGYKSLSGYCVHGLKLGRTQTQRLVTRVRRFQAEPN